MRRLSFPATGTNTDIWSDWAPPEHCPALWVTTTTGWSHETASAGGELTEGFPHVFGSFLRAVSCAATGGGLTTPRVIWTTPSESASKTATVARPLTPQSRSTAGGAGGEIGSGGCVDGPGSTAGPRSGPWPRRQCSAPAGSDRAAIGITRARATKRRVTYPS